MFETVGVLALQTFGTVGFPRFLLRYDGGMVLSMLTRSFPYPGLRFDAKHCLILKDYFHLIYLSISFSHPSRFVISLELSCKTTCKHITL